MRSWIILLTLLWTPMVWSATIYVAPVQGTNITENTSKTLRELIKVEVQNDSNHRLVDALDQAQFFIQTKVIKLDNFTLSMTRWRGNDKVSSGQWKANNLSDLEAKISVAVPEIINTEINKNSAQLFDDKKSLGERAAEKNQNASNERVEARRQVIIGFGPAFFDNMNTAESGLGFQAGYVWNINDHFDLGLQSDFAISTSHSDAWMFGGKVNTNYHFNSKDISPFIGAGFGYAWASLHDNNVSNIPDDSASGFAVGLQGGVKFFRTSTVNLAVSGEYTRIFNKASLGQPAVFFLKVALLY